MTWLIALATALTLTGTAACPTGGPVAVASHPATDRQREISARVSRTLAESRRTLHQARIAQYGTTPFMRHFLTYYQHRMRWPSVPPELIEQGNGEAPPGWGKPGQFVPPAPVHYLMAGALERGLSSYAPTLEVVEVFRGCGKSTEITEAGLPYCITKGRLNCLLFSATTGEVKNRVQGITHELVTNPTLVRDHPELARGKDDKGQWVSYTDNHIVFANGGRIKGYEFGAEIRGSLWNGERPSVVLVDDGEKTKEQRSPELLAQRRYWVQHVLLPALAPHCLLLWVGTPLSPQCTLLWAVNELGWEHVKQPIRNPDGSPHWPEFWPEERIEWARQEKVLGEHAYQQEMMLNSLPEGDQVFRAEHFDANHFAPRLLSGLGSRRIEYNGQPLAVYSWWDSAISLKNTAARTAIVTVGALPHDGSKPRLLVLDARFGRWPDDVQKEQLRAVNEQFRPREIGAQATLLEKAIGPAARRQYGVPFQEYVQNNSADAKHARIKSLQPLCAEGQILFDHSQESQSGKDGLRGELVNYPFHPTNDILDALEGAAKLALEKGGSGTGISLGHQPKVESAGGLGKW